MYSMYSTAYTVYTVYIKREGVSFCCPLTEVHTAGGEKKKPGQELL